MSPFDFVLYFLIALQHVFSSIAFVFSTLLIDSRVPYRSSLFFDYLPWIPRFISFCPRATIVVVLLELIISYSNTLPYSIVDGDIVKKQLFCRSASVYTIYFIYSSFFF